MELVDASINITTNIAQSLRPPVLDDGGIVGALESLAREFKNRFEIDCKVIADTSASQLKSKQVLGLYRIVQEALTNVARHSQATEASISLLQGGGRLTLNISDNGKGIGPDAIADPKAIGLVGMKERAMAIGARLVIAGSRHQGTVVTIEVPLPLQ